MTIYAAGAVLWRVQKNSTQNDSTQGDSTQRNQVEVALVHRPRYNDWSLPKGKLQQGETAAFAAVREIAEETGYHAILGRKVARIGYPVHGEVKVVDYFAAQADNGEFVPNDEVDELRWLSVPAARSLCSYRDEHEALAIFSSLPAKLTTVLLVRHAKAGKRLGQRDEDVLRPLSSAGQSQAEAIRILLPLFGADRVHAAPLTRCVQTVQGLADDLMTKVTYEPLFSETFYWRHQAKTVTRMLELVKQGGTPVISSQGGVIPDLLVHLADQSGINLVRAQSKKGSVWVLSFICGAQMTTPLLLAADYVASPLAKPAVEN